MNKAKYKEDSNEISKRVFDQELEIQLKEICHSLKETTTPFQILNWLENFKEHEIPIALTVLKNLKYFKVEDIIKEFDFHLDKYLNENRGNVYIHGLGEFGKSGDAMIYYLKQAPAFNKTNRIKILSHIKKLKNQGLKNESNLILLDDIIGSGKSATGFYKANIKHQISKDKLSLNISIISVVIMEDALLELEKEIPSIKVYSTTYKKAFAANGSVFGYRPRMLNVREFCYKYGVDLFRKYDYKKKNDQPHPLGFENSQSLIVFAHSVPNNTVPIIWSEKNNWYPLFPRQGKGKISKVISFRDETMIWLSIARKIGLLKEDEHTHNVFFNNMNYKLMAVIRMKKKNSNDITISQTLSLTLKDYEAIKEEGKRLGIFDNEFNITDFGNSKYEEIIKKININRTNNKMNKYTFEEIYVPKTFLGIT